MAITQTDTQGVKHTYYSQDDDLAITPGEAIRTTLLNRVSWAAVFAGVVIAFATQLVLNLLGVGIGFASVETLDASVAATTGSAGAYEFSWAAAAWWTISGIIAAYVGGFSAGRLSGEPKFTTAAWHGLTTWALSIMVLTVMMASAGAAVHMGSPYQLVIDQQAATVYGRTGNYAAGATAGTTTSPDTSVFGSTAPGSVITPSASGSQTMRPAVVDPDTLAAAALISSVALILCAMAAWFGGRAGTIKSQRVVSGPDTPVYTH